MESIEKRIRELEEGKRPCGARIKEEDCPSFKKNKAGLAASALASAVHQVRSHKYLTIIYQFFVGQP